MMRFGPGGLQATLRTGQQERLGYRATGVEDERFESLPLSCDLSFGSGGETCLELCFGRGIWLAAFLESIGMEWSLLALVFNLVQDVMHYTTGCW